MSGPPGAQSALAEAMDWVAREQGLFLTALESGSRGSWCQRGHLP